MNKKNGLLFIIIGIILIIMGLLYFNKDTVDKKYYIETVNQMIDKVKEENENGKYGFLDNNSLYLIPYNLIDFKNKDINFKDAYIAITFDGSNYKYYFIGVDKDGYGIDDLTIKEDLEEDLIENIGKIGEISLDGFDSTKLLGQDGSFSDYIYVDEEKDKSNAPQIDTCPGCVYKFSTKQIDIGEKLNNYEYDYRKINHKMFLGAIIDNNDMVEKLYACGIANKGQNNEKVFCIEAPVNIEIEDSISNYLANELVVYFDYCNPGLDVYKDKGVYCYSDNLIAEIDRKNPDKGTPHFVEISSRDYKESCTLFNDNGGHCSVLR